MSPKKTRIQAVFAKLLQLWSPSKQNAEEKAAVVEKTPTMKPRLRNEE